VPPSEFFASGQQPPQIAVGLNLENRVLAILWDSGLGAVFGQAGEGDGDLVAILFIAAGAHHGMTEHQALLHRRAVAAQDQNVRSRNAVALIFALQRMAATGGQHQQQGHERNRAYLDHGIVPWHSGGRP